MPEKERRELEENVWRRIDVLDLDARRVQGTPMTGDNLAEGAHVNQIKNNKICKQSFGMASSLVGEMINKNMTAREAKSKIKQVRSVLKTANKSIDPNDKIVVQELSTVLDELNNMKKGKQGLRLTDLKERVDNMNQRYQV